MVPLYHHYTSTTGIATEIYELKDFIILGTQKWIDNYANYAMNTISWWQRPHWKNTVKKYLNVIRILTKFAEPENVKSFLQDAMNYFDEVPRRRAFNLLFKDVYIGCLLSRQNEEKYTLTGEWDTSKSKKFEDKYRHRFHYYLAVRIRKRRIPLKGHPNIKVLAYEARINKMCPFGQCIHLMAGIDDDGNIVYKKPIHLIAGILPNEEFTNEFYAYRIYDGILKSVNRWKPRRKKE